MLTWNIGSFTYTGNTSPTFGGASFYYPVKGSSGAAVIPSSLYSVLSNNTINFRGAKFVAPLIVPGLGISSIIDWWAGATSALPALSSFYTVSNSSTVNYKGASFVSPVFIKHPFQGLIVDWQAGAGLAPAMAAALYSIGTGSSTVYMGASYVAPVIVTHPFQGAIIDWQTGPGAGSHSTGPLIFIYSNKSLTAGQVQNYNDGVINVTAFSVNNQYPILEACRRILKQTGKVGQPYKLAVQKNGQTEYTVRSIYWGTLMNMNDQETNVQLIDRQGVSPL